MPSVDEIVEVESDGYDEEEQEAETIPTFLLFLRDLTADLRREKQMFDIGVEAAEVEGVISIGSFYSI